MQIPTVRPTWSKQADGSAVQEDLFRTARHEGTGSSFKRARRGERRIGTLPAPNQRYGDVGHATAMPDAIRPTVIMQSRCQTTEIEPFFTGLVFVYVFENNMVSRLTKQQENRRHALDANSLPIR